MRFSRVMCLVLLAFWVASPCLSEGTWYTLMDNQTYVDDFVLASGESKEIVVNSSIPLWVGFMSSAGMEEFEKYGESNPVKLSQPGSGSWVETLMGGSILLNPTDGQLRCVLENNAPEALEFVVYTKEDM